MESAHEKAQGELGIILHKIYNLSVSFLFILEERLIHVPAMLLIGLICQLFAYHNKNVIWVSSII